MAVSLDFTAPAIKIVPLFTIKWEYYSRVLATMMRPLPGLLDLF